MTQEDFVERSKKAVTYLNNGGKSAREAWRDGFLEAITQIYKLMETESLESVENFVEEIMHSNLSEYE